MVLVGATFKGKTTLETFPIKLHTILERNEMDGYSDIISWLPHGRAFRIHDSNAFVAKVNSKYFYISKINLFICRLSLYGFRNVSRKGIDKCAYYHEMFLRDWNGLSRGICIIKDRSVNLKSINVDPNFYSMLPIIRIHTIDDVKEVSLMKMPTINLD